MYIGQTNMVSVENISIPTKLLNIKNVRFIILLKHVEVIVQWKNTWISNPTNLIEMTNYTWIIIILYIKCEHREKKTELVDKISLYVNKNAKVKRTMLLLINFYKATLYFCLYFCLLTRKSKKISGYPYLYGYVASNNIID